MQVDLNSKNMQAIAQAKCKSPLSPPLPHPLQRKSCTNSSPVNSSLGSEKQSSVGYTVIENLPYLSTLKTNVFFSPCNMNNILN